MAKDRRRRAAGSRRGRGKPQQAQGKGEGKGKGRQRKENGDECDWRNWRRRWKQRAAFGVQYSGEAGERASSPVGDVREKGRPRLFRFGEFDPQFASWKTTTTFGDRRKRR